MVPSRIDVDDGDGFLDLVGRFHQGDALALDVVRPQPLVRPPPVVLDDMVGGVQDGLGGAVVLFQLDDGGVGKVALEVQDDLDVRAPEGVDALVVVADDADVFVLAANRVSSWYWLSFTS